MGIPHVCDLWHQAHWGVSVDADLISICGQGHHQTVFPKRDWPIIEAFGVSGKYCLRKGDGSGYGPTKGFRLIATTLDPKTLQLDAAWYLATTLPLEEANPTQVYEFYPLRAWIEHYFKQAKYELWWADFQVRPERAIVRHWELVLLATTFSLLVGAVPRSPSSQDPPRRR